MLLRGSETGRLLWQTEHTEAPGLFKYVHQLHSEPVGGNTETRGRESICFPTDDIDTDGAMRQHNGISKESKQTSNKDGRRGGRKEEREGAKEQGERKEAKKERGNGEGRREGERREGGR